MLLSLEIDLFYAFLASQSTKLIFLKISCTDYKTAIFFIIEYNFKNIFIIQFQYISED